MVENGARQSDTTDYARGRGARGARLVCGVALGERGDARAPAAQQPGGRWVWTCLTDEMTKTKVSAPPTCQPGVSGCVGDRGAQFTAEMVTQ